ncbi:MAG: DUF5107 domain-containing protein [Draconibacterium sp.]
MKNLLLFVWLVLSVAVSFHACSQQASISESMMLFKTYPYSDPDPVAKITHFYPYYRFDGFTNTPLEQEWKIVTLENPYIKVLVAPEMGGKAIFYNIKQECILGWMKNLAVKCGVFCCMSVLFFGR